MIETEQSVTIAAPIGEVWDYAKDVQRWAEIMPGYQQCDIADEDNSRWILKVGVGGLVRTVKVQVHVDEWAGPERVAFSFKLDGDPVSGSGSYKAVANGSGTDVTLHVRVEGSGPMAAMWEAMGGPLLPKFARSFAEQLRDRIEAVSTGVPLASPPSLRTRFIAWLRRLFA
jgi:carbon monoxide dehydrogenase subunit G